MHLHVNVRFVVDSSQSPLVFIDFNGPRELQLEHSSGKLTDIYLP